MHVVGHGVAPLGGLATVHELIGYGVKLLELEGSSLRVVAKSACHSQVLRACIKDYVSWLTEWSA
jgi:hypothetical protein